jgi:hypothetical protein
MNEVLTNLLLIAAAFGIAIWGSNYFEDHKKSQLLTQQVMLELKQILEKKINHTIQVYHKDLELLIDVCSKDRWTEKISSGENIYMDCRLTGDFYDPGNLLQEPNPPPASETTLVDMQYKEVYLSAGWKYNNVRIIFFARNSPDGESFATAIKNLY